MRPSTSIVILILLTVVSLPLSGQVLAFPGAEGYGRYTTGGRGGVVVEVTNLDDSGPGSLRAALRMKVPRIVVFRVSGTIVLQSELQIDYGNLTIAGQTAPGEGVCVSGNRTTLNADNIIIRFMRFRQGDETGVPEDAITAMNCKNVIIDHCSMSWGIDEVGSFYDNENFTLQWSIIAEALNNSIHPKGEHGYGGIWGGVKATFHHNLLAHNASRNPRFNGARTGTRAEKELVDFRNNVIYNWGHNSAYGGEGGRYNLINNYYKPGPASHKRDRIVEPLSDEGRWYISGNVVEGSPEVTADNWAGGVQGKYASEQYIRSENRFGEETIKTDSAEEAYCKVLKYAGALLPEQDEADKRVIAEAREGKVSIRDGIINSQTEVGGFPVLSADFPPEDSDKDGMPDQWEKENGLNPDDASDGAKLTENGYTWIEIYLNELAKDIYKD